ncbi:hypothetical protein MYX75_03885 [Acidobacteria bacterium AH-259-A15]|nr:hypothetical protein [Acidobacteria bacterium AH-259-A15]
MGNSFVNGKWVMTHEGDFNFIIDPTRNPPKIIQKLDKKFAVSPPRLNITMPIPLSKEQHLISVGFLTMAYLYWFTFFGYSWVMQRHLGIVREQILHPDRSMINERCFTKFINDGSSFELPHFCAAMISEITCACLLYQNVIVFFPTPHSPRVYHQLERFSGDGVKTSSEVKFFNLDAFYLGAMVSISHHNKLIVLPDAMPDLMDTGAPNVHILFTHDKGPEPTIVQPISAEDANRLKRLGKPVRTISIRHRKHPPQSPIALLPA